jgi:ATP-dependent Clp endopeptidase proteolytic subunit ClpP
MSTLEDRKLEAEIAKLEAETEVARLGAIEKNHMIASYEDNQGKRLAKAEEHNLYTFWGTVSEDRVDHAIRTLGEWSRTRPGAAITIVLNSPGGSVIDGLALFDFIQVLKQAGHHIEVVAAGYAASMGGVLLQAGTTRVAQRNSFMLIHEAATVAGGKSSDLEDQVKFIERLQKKLLAILAERSTLSEQQIRNRWKRKDWWLDADEMLALGFVDEIRG